jgi:2-keto-4-pentenoate hydratase
MTDWKLDHRITRGIDSLKLKLKDDLNQGARHIGWKLAFGSPTGLAGLRIEKPLVGYLLDRNEISSGSTIGISTWTKPVGEAEIAIYFNKDIPHSASITDVLSCAAALGPAIEIADLDLLPTDPESILAGDIFQRHYILGQKDSSRSGGNIETLTAQVLLPNGLTVTVEDLPELTGQIPMILHHFAQVAEEINGGVKAGEFLLIGSIVPPIAVSAGESFSYSLGNYPTLQVGFSS